MTELFEKYVDWRILSFFLRNPSDEYYIKQLSRILKVSPASVSDAVRRFEALDLLHKEEKGQTHLFSLNNESVLVKQLKKTYTTARLLKSNFVKKFLDVDSSIVSIAVYGSYANGEYDSKSDLDILVITQHKKRDLSPIVRQLEDELSLEINVETLTFSDWNKLARANDPFYNDVIGNNILFFGSML